MQALAFTALAGTRPNSLAARGAINDSRAQGESRPAGDGCRAKWLAGAGPRCCRDDLQG